MKKLFRTFVCALMAPIALVSCNILNEDVQGDNLNANAVCNETLLRTFPADSHCLSEDRKLVEVYDVEELIFEFEGASCSSKEDREICLKGVLVNGEYINFRDLDAMISNGTIDKEAIRDEVLNYYDRNERYSKIVNQSRDLVIPCEIAHYGRFWKAMLTEEEITELQETYTDVSVFPVIYVNYVNDGGNGEPTTENGEVTTQETNELAPCR